MAAADSLDARPRLSREELESAGSATNEDVDLVKGMAAQSGLKVRDVDRVGRRVVLEGPIGALQDAFGVRISRREAAGEPYLGYAGEIQLPGDLDGVVTAVLGLSDRPAARPR
jgi:kumamolisin